ncbi:MAG: hypothetical protein M3R61_00505 [Chloroflexota bacterium]|nr:hypothetical protein [Chloroflexota bacterium]
MSYEQIEQRRAQLGLARNTAEQLCYEAIEDAIMDVIAAARSQDTLQVATATARAGVYLEAISTYRRCADKGHPFVGSAQQPSTPALIAAAPALLDALTAVLYAKRTHPERDGASYWAILLTPRQIGAIRDAIALATGEEPPIQHGRMGIGA